LEVVSILLVVRVVKYRSDGFGEIRSNRSRHRKVVGLLDAHPVLEGATFRVYASCVLRHVSASENEQLQPATAAAFPEFTPSFSLPDPMS
jgi:hypothetical protein